MSTLVRIGSEGEANRQTLALFHPSTRRNSRLPHEVLATIFIHCAHDYHFGLTGCPTRTAPSWVNVSYVCRYWRVVALSCPTLWTYVFITSQRWTEELLVRSEQASLKLRVSLLFADDEPWLLASLEKAMEHMERIQQLRPELPALCAQRILSKLYPRAPRLQNLEISLGSCSLESWSSVLFDGDTPSLHTLELLHCPVPWFSLKLSSLTTLSLGHVPVQFQQSTEELLATLSCMQDLAHLYLIHALPRSREFISSPAFKTFQKIDLPRLSRLEIDDVLSHLIAFLSCVNIPSNTKVKLECDLDDYDASEDDFSLLSSILARRFCASADPALSNPTIRSLVIERDGNVAIFTFSALDREHEPCVSNPYMSITDSGCNIPLQIYLYCDQRQIINERYISDICCSMPLMDVQNLHVVTPPISVDFWKRILGYLQDLRYLKLSRGYMPKLASLLSFTAHENPVEHGGGDLNTYAPALEEVELYRIALMIDPRVSNTRILGSGDLSSLQDALSTRKDPQVRLKIFACVEYHTADDREFEGGDN
ncbi:hypothetical protein V8E55_001454 [Tylopilus felleus]